VATEPLHHCLATIGLQCYEVTL